MKKIKEMDRGSLTVMTCAVLGIVAVSVAGVLVVRAYLTAKTNDKINQFAPMTYTNTQIEENTPETIPFEIPEDPQNDDPVVPNATQEGGKWKVSVTKEAHVRNLEGNDKKPVFIRVAVRYSVYTHAGTAPDEYLLNVTPSNPLSLNFTTTGNWINGNDGYYYYKYIVDPGHQTDSLFSGNTVQLLMDTKPEVGLIYGIDISADTVQAVSTDSSKWTTDDYEYNDANNAWGKNLASMGVQKTTQP